MANIGPDNFELVKELLGDKNTGEEVKLTTLGRFEICGRAYKMFFDPEAKEWFDAPTRLDVYFHPSKKLTDFIDYNLRPKA